ncbi:hypothetical protein V1264_000330 [Littorina saxatilis]|uniref:Uncharacterized protein n=1 Tax=Littorina saxatilis TaxID=31220 RepID=A0AAN9GMM6_9CAEN
MSFLPAVHHGEVNACLVSSEHQRIVTCGSDRLLRVIDMETLTELFSKDIQHEILCVGALNGAVVTGDKEGYLRVWDMDIGQVAAQLQAHTGPVSCLNTRVKGAVLSGGQDRCVKLWKPHH